MLGLLKSLLAFQRSESGDLDVLRGGKRHGDILSRRQMGAHAIRAPREVDARYLWRSGLRRASAIPSRRRRLIPLRPYDLPTSEEAAFVKTLFRRIPLRAPSSGGVAHDLLLVIDAASKPAVIGRVRYSSEGKLPSVGIRGLPFRMIEAALYHVPILGYAPEANCIESRLPIALRNLRQLNSSSLLSHRRTREHIGSFAEAGTRNVQKSGSR